MGYFVVQDRSPGPGAYNPSIRPVVRSGPAFTMAGKRRDSTCDQWKLGPGMYHPRTGPEGPAFSISGKGTRNLHLEKVWLVQPVNKASAASKAGGKRWAPRCVLLSEITPGPGAYNMPSSDRGPAFSVSSKGVPKYTTDAPGPGTYYYVSRPQSPSYSMANRYPPPRTVHPPPRTVYGEFFNSPGPAQYRPDRGSWYAGKRGPAFTIPGKRHPAQDNGLPGPGTYFPPQNNTFGQDIACHHVQECLWKSEN